MASVQIARNEMLKRVAHFQDLKPLDYQALGRGSIPEGMTGFSLIGQVGKHLTPAIPGDHGFTVGLAKVSPGKGSPPHTHTTVEVFIPLSGKWVFTWGPTGTEEETILEPWDTISFPQGLMHGFRNLSEEEACFLAILGGTAMGEITYASQG